LTGGRVIQTFFVVMQALFSLGSSVPGVVAITSAQIAAAKMLKVIRRVPVIDVADTGGIKPEILGRIEFRDVCFAYPARLTVPILKNFNLVIERGQSVAFVGPSGSGKSTIVALVLRMYDPQSGSIYIDGKDIKDINVVHLRSALGLVSQDPQLFSLSVSQNIALGKQNQVASQEEIVAAARAANAHSFVCSLPEAYDTVVGTSVNSSQISGGQRQRICIARCLIRKPAIMLFDEATSALDIESEVAVQHSIDELLSTSSRPTSLVIAHRLSTIVNADRICVVDHGRVVQSGSHSELMREETGLYHHLQTLQQLHIVPETQPNADVSTDAPPSPPSMPLHRTSDPPLRRVSGATVQGAAPPPSNLTEEHADVPESRVWAMQAPEMRYIIPGLVCSLANGGVNTLVGFVLARSISAFYLPGSEMEAALLNVVGYFMAIAVGLFLLNLFNHWFFSIAGEALSARLRCMTFAHILNMEIGFFDEKGHSAGSLEARLSADAGLVKGATGPALSQVVSSAGALAVGIVVAMQATWRIGLIVLATVPIQVVCGAYMILAFNSDNKMDKEALEKSGHVASEAAIAIRTVSSLNLQAWMCSKFAADTAPRFAAAKSGALKYAASMFFGIFSISAVPSLAWFVAGIFINDGVLTFPDFVAAFFAVQFAGSAVQQALAYGPEKSKGIVAIASIFNILDRKSRIDSTSDGVCPAQCLGHIEFRSVTFAYPMRLDRPVLNKFSCVIEAGQSVALVGPSGCGKSSVIALLLRFYEPQSGTILLDGIDITTLNPQWLRSHIGYVQQEPALFDNSIHQNIEYGRVVSDASELAPDAQQSAIGSDIPSDVITAASQANALEFISSLPNAFNTQCGARGSQLSGGQKQRIAIARMLLRNAPIMLLDEATSALDSESELVVQKVSINSILDPSDTHRMQTGAG